MCALVKELNVDILESNDNNLLTLIAEKILILC